MDMLAFLLGKTKGAQPVHRICEQFENGDTDLWQVRFWKKIPPLEGGTTSLSLFQGVAAATGTKVFGKLLMTDSIYHVCAAKRKCPAQSRVPKQSEFHRTE